MPTKCFTKLFICMSIMLSHGAGLATEQALQVAVGSDDQSVKPEDQSVKIVAAAQALLECLSEAERSAVLFQFNDEDQRVRWSNLPSGIFARKGLRMGDLRPEKHVAVMEVLKQTLSRKGLQQVIDNVAADETLNAGGQRGRVIFGKDEFYFSILGTPSIDEPWMWQFGGHHLAVNATIVRNQVTLGPSLTGGQPMNYSLDGKQISQMADEVSIAFELINSLDEAQRSKAILSDQFGNMILGPGRDDVRPEPEGIVGSDMTAAQKSLLKRLIEERLRWLNDEDASERIAAFEAQFNDTYFSWQGPLKPGSAASYRVQGPGFFLEYSPQQMGGAPMEHIHAMYREFGNDYGEEWIHGNVKLNSLP